MAVAVWVAVGTAVSVALETGVEAAVGVCVAVGTGLGVSVAVGEDVDVSCGDRRWRGRVSRGRRGSGSLGWSGRVRGSGDRRVSWSRRLDRYDFLYHHDFD